MRCTNEKKTLPPLAHRNGPMEHAMHSDMYTTLQIKSNRHTALALQRLANARKNHAPPGED